MHNAPAVVYPVGRSHFQAQLMAGLLACDGLALARWGASVDAVGWPHMLAGAFTALVAAAMLRAWWQTPQGQLIWDGSVWTLALQASATQVQPELVLDFQAALLLRLRGPDKPQLRWVWLERSSHATRWLALRRAVHDPAGFKVQAGPDGASVWEPSP